MWETVVFEWPQPSQKQASQSDGKEEGSTRQNWRELCYVKYQGTKVPRVRRILGGTGRSRLRAR